MTSEPTTHRVVAPLPLILIAFLAAGAALIGGYWDDTWHTERGRDAFLIAPHIAIYAGIAGAGGALTLWAYLVARRAGLTAVWHHKPLVLALVSVAATLASGPIDNFWHVAFGRDAVIWSAPHMLGIAGTLALAAAMLAELAGRSEPWARPLSLVAGALVIAAAGFSTVEYDTDVPQFSVLWYLPVLGFASAIALSIVRVASPVLWAATGSALLYLAFILVVSGVLALLEFLPPALPLLALPALVVDIGSRRGWHPALIAAAFSAALFGSYVPVRNLLGEGVEISATDVALGLPFTALACWLVFAVAFGGGPRGKALAGATAIGALILPAAALAHDPGQGESAGTAEVALEREGASIEISVEPERDLCEETDPVAVVARRAGEVVSAPLADAGCRFQGVVELPDEGRWFIYAEMRREGQALETWLPISVGSGPSEVAEEDRYVYEPPESAGGAGETIASIAIYGGVWALLHAALALVRSSRREH